jgi:hypothetical protein
VCVFNLLFFSLLFEMVVAYVVPLQKNRAKLAMPANTLTVQECGAYKQQIEKEIRTLRPRYPAPYATLGPYAIPPPPAAAAAAAGAAGDKNRSATPRANSRSSSRSGSSSRASSRATAELSVRLQILEQELQREKDSRQLAEDKLDKLQERLEKLAAEKKEAASQ